MECFSYKGECDILMWAVHVSKCLKDGLVWATDKRLQVITNLKQFYH